MMPMHGQVAANVEAGPGGAAETRLIIKDRNVMIATTVTIGHRVSSMTDQSARAS
jgi:hypothetical protein